MAAGRPSQASTNAASLGISLGKSIWQSTKAAAVPPQLWPKVLPPIA